MRKIFSRRGAGEKAAAETGAGRRLRIVAPFFRDHWPKLVLGFLALVGVDFCQLLVPRVIKFAVDALQAGKASSGGLFFYGGMIVLLATLTAGLRFLWRSLLLGFSRILETRLRDRMFAHVLTLDRAFFQRRTPGEIMALVTNDLSSIQLAGGMGLVAFVDAAFMGFAAFIFMAWINPVLALVAVSPMPILAVLTRYLSAKLHKRFGKVQEQFSDMTEFVRSTLTNIRLVKAYNQETAQVERFDAMGKTYVRDNMRLAVINGTLFPVSGFVGNFSLLLVLFFGGRMAVSGKVTAGDFVAFINYLYLMTWPMMAMGWVTDLFQRGMTSLGRIESLLDEQPDLKDAANPETSQVLKGDIRVQNLTFSYPGYPAPVLRGIDIEIPAGSFVGVVGKTGAGKTTLCHILARLYPVGEGAVFFDGVDVNALSTANVRGAVAYVPQDVVLFSETVAFNISMGRPDASQEEIEAAARAAAVHDEIAAMKNGYATRIGERGVKLSGGQRQRIAIARALLLDRPVVVIDDGLSAVDMETEHAVILSIATYLRGRTCIVVSHRVAPLADADEIIVLDGGKIAARGGHRELMETSPFYATIYEQQTARR